MKNFINLIDIDKKELRQIIDQAKIYKKNQFAQRSNFPFKGKTLIMILEKNSLRTRISFELAFKKLGGEVLTLNPKEIHYGSGDESIYDTAKVLSQYGDIVMMRTNKHERFLKFSEHLDIPLINGMTSISHPVQVLTDIFTIEERLGISINNQRIAWIGDFNNILKSYLEASVKFPFKLNIACPEKLRDAKYIKWAKSKKAKILMTKDPKEAAYQSSVVVTDKWISMSDKTNKEKKRKLLKPYQVNSKIIKLAKSNVIFCHCLPASVGDEVTSKVLYGPNSIVFKQALNRIYIQMAIINWCLK